ncbi:EamA family transporter RarD [Heyndrickxia acidicola]|uniref:EamA family transporter RarD n=1 Tax=Heyndrickxia acidicola TaxID=209389 RepID=A0ABU6MHR4_9BACI|nr:EamA family transporter RarD [Heyndrickxia acidicola]MED1203188.1 EamA family transporter RarD [Heyndrickxia acidicola]
MKNEERSGMAFAALSYIIWGVLPIYWKWLDGITANEILANRVLWSFVFVLLILMTTGKLGNLLQTAGYLKKNPKILGSLVIASLLVTGNWFIYIWAVNSDQIVEASLGYYINPLISILLGVFFLREKLTRAQILSFLIAAAGVGILTFSYGKFPWVALSLALTFGLYGLAKKLIKVESVIGLTLETMTVTPLAIVYLVYLSFQGKLSLFHTSAVNEFLLMGAGVVTAIPLLLFAKGAQKIPLYMLGFLQYIAPTIMLILGVFFYNEPFSMVQIGAFICIWTAVLITTISNMKWLHTKAGKWKKGKTFQA